MAINHPWEVIKEEEQSWSLLSWLNEQVPIWPYNRISNCKARNIQTVPSGTSIVNMTFQTTLPKQNDSVSSTWLSLNN